MNEALRLFQKCLRPFGYDIRKRKTLNLLPFKGIEPVPALVCVREAFDSDGAPELKRSSDLGRVKIIYRTCVTAARNSKAHNRVSGASLIETVERCFFSLVSSVNAALSKEDCPDIEVVLLDDHSDIDFLERIERVASALRCRWSITTTELRGQGASLHQQFSLAKSDNALYYFCEDDYLHETSAIYEMWCFYKQLYASTRKHLVLHPQEHECLYNSSFYPSYLVLSPTRHWRSASDATHIFFTHSHVVDAFWIYFENTKYVGDRKNRHLGSERQTTNRLFDHIPCFVPIPALAGHLQSEHVLPPFFRWQQLWDENRI